VSSVHLLLGSNVLNILKKKETDIICYLLRNIRTFVPALEPAQQAVTQTDDLERDHVLSQRIKLFQWVSEEHLDLPQHEDTASFVEFAKQGMAHFSLSSTQ